MLCYSSLFELIGPYLVLPLLLFANYSSFAFHYFCCFVAVAMWSLFISSFPSDSEVSSVFMNSLISSSHLFRGLPTDLCVLIQLSRPGSHSAVVLDHRSSRRGALLFAILHFFLLCSIKQGMFAFIIHYSPSLVLFLYSIQSLSSISILSISPSISSEKETSLSWSQSVIDIDPSSSISELRCSSLSFA